MGKAPNPVDIEIAQKVRARRIELGLTQGDLAEALGVTYQQFQKYERGLNRISAGRLHQLADLLRTPLAQFFNDLPDASSLPDAVADLLGLAEGPQLVAAFRRISSRTLRRSIVALVQELSQEQD